MLALAFENPAIPSAPAVTPPPSRTILALDLGTRTGWAVLPRSARIASGVTEFRPGRFEGAGMAFLRFEKFLADLNRDAGPFDAVVFEEVRALSRRAHGHDQAPCHRQGQCAEGGRDPRLAGARLPAEGRQRGRCSGASRLGHRQ